jgi:hypothetical protein
MLQPKQLWFLEKTIRVISSGGGALGGYVKGKYEMSAENKAREVTDRKGGVGDATNKSEFKSKNVQRQIIIHNLP